MSCCTVYVIIHSLIETNRKLRSTGLKIIYVMQPMILNAAATKLIFENSDRWSYEVGNDVAVMIYNYEVCSWLQSMDL